MAQFTVQGRLKPLFNGDGMPIGLESKDPHHHYRRRHHRKLLGGDPVPFPLRFHKRKLRFHGSSSSRLFASSSSPSSSSSRKSNHFNVEASLTVDNDGIYDDSEDIDEFERDELSCFRGLVLDIAYRSVIFFFNCYCLSMLSAGNALFVWSSWKRSVVQVQDGPAAAVKQIEEASDSFMHAPLGSGDIAQSADVLEYYDQTVNSPSGSFYIPAVLRVPHLLQVVKRRRIKNTLSRKNIFYRDSFTCQYCSSRENLTIDHVLPIARGGKWTWENLVTACSKCNSKKGQHTLEEANMKLLKVAKAPKDYDILAIPLTSTAIKMLRMRKGTPEEWLQYLPKPSSEP